MTDYQRYFTGIHPCISSYIQITKLKRKTKKQQQKKQHPHNGTNFLFIHLLSRKKHLLWFAEDMWCNGNA